LSYAKEKLGKVKPGKIEAKAIEMMSIKHFEPEYFEIVDGCSMERIKDPEAHDLIVACTASWAGKIRLIDNLILKGEAELFAE
jgi:pantothenate synthetase